MFWIKASQLILTIVVTGWFIQWLRQQGHQASDSVQNGKVMRASCGAYLLAYVSILFWSALLVLSSLFPGRNPENLWLAQSVFGLFLVMSLALALSCHTWVIVWNATGISGPTWYGKRTHFAWDQVTHCDYNPSLQVFRLKNAEQQSIWVPESWKGFSELLKYIEAEHSRLLPTPSED